MNRRASPIDDIYSLLCVAYKFVNLWLPWEECLEQMYKAKPDSNIFSTKEVTKLRCQEWKKFDRRLIKKSKELRPLFQYAYNLRIIKNKRDEEMKILRQSAPMTDLVDYRCCMNLLPDLPIA